MTVSVYPPTIDSIGMGVISGAGKGIYEHSHLQAGYNPDMDQNSLPEAVWPPGGPMTWPVAGVPSIESDSNADDATGTGARTVLVEGVSPTFELISELVSLDGTNPVNLVNTYLYVHKMYVEDSGANGVNDGGITLSIGGVDTCYISEGHGESLQSSMVLPDYEDQVPHLMQFWGGIARNQATTSRMILYRQPDGGSKRINNNLLLNSTGVSVIPITLETPQEFAPGDRVWWSCESLSANNVEVFAGFEIAWI